MFWQPEAMDQACRIWIWECRAKLHFGRSLAAVDDYLDLDIECLRECLIEGFSTGKVPHLHRLLFEDAMHLLTSLRFSNPWKPCWILTALPAWERIQHTRQPISILDEWTLAKMMATLDFLESIETCVPGAHMNWPYVRAWIRKQWLKASRDDLNKMD